MPNEVVTPTRWFRKGEVEVPSRKRQHPGKPLLLFGGIPGETAEAHIMRVGKNRAYGYWAGSKNPSPDRVEPPCDRFGPCGGCALMHINEGAQERARRTLIAEAFQEVGMHELELGEWFACPDGQEGFRHVIKLGFGRSDQGRLRVGAWGRNDRRVVPIPKCNVAAPILREVMKSLAHHAIELDIWPWEQETQRGVLRSAVLRASRTTGEVLVTLVAGKRNHLLGDLAEAIAQGVPEVVGVWLHVNSEPGNAIFVRNGEGVVGVRGLLGKDTIEEEVNGIRYQIGPGDFFQTNPATAEVLYARTLERLQLGDDTPVVDLYCGVGGFALQAAKHTGWALGVEEVEGAVVRARDAARRNGISGAEFLSDVVLYALPDLVKRVKHLRPVITVNPARRGLEEGVIEGIVGLEPRRIAYISCNPRALARDLAHFRDKGYRIGPIDMFDMFPNTPHVETLTVLEAPDADQAGGRAPRRKVVRR